MEGENKNVATAENAGAVAGPPVASVAVAADAGEVQKPNATAEAAAPVVEKPTTITTVGEVDGVTIVQHAGASPDATITIQMATAVPDPPDRQVAAEMVTRFLGHQGGVARDAVADLNDDEARQVIAAATDRFTARTRIKSVLSRAYDRRREEAAKKTAELADAERKKGLSQNEDETKAPSP